MPDDLPYVRVPLRLRPLDRSDLPSLSWAGNSTHLEHVGEALDRVAEGEVVYLCVCGPAGLPLAVGAIRFSPLERSGYIWQVVTHPALRSLGLGALLVSGLEAAARVRGCRLVELGVEEENRRARALYERLGYRSVRRERATWIVEDLSGRRFPYSTWCTMMVKELS